MNKTRKLVIGGLYKHFKGYLMRVICEARHSETEEKMVVYVHLDSGGKIWVRSRKMFLGKVEKDGKKVYRFKLVEEK